MELTELLLPVLAAAAAVFVASSILHMVLPVHAGDYDRLPGEDAVAQAMRDAGVRKGNYVLPYCNSMKAMGSDEMIAKYKQGPVGFLLVLESGPPAMGKALVQWFAYCVLISLLTAYIASFNLAPGTDYMVVFRLTGTIGLLGYGVGALSDSIWKGVKWSTSFKFVFDGLIYALVAAGVFASMWPGVTVPG